MSILLTAEEIRAIPGSSFGGCEDDLNVAKAQLKKVATWGIDECPHETPMPSYHVNSYFKRACPECWRVLMGEAGIE